MDPAAPIVPISASQRQSVKALGQTTPEVNLNIEWRAQLHGDVPRKSNFGGRTSRPMTVPDYISPVASYRVWQWDAAGLKSLNGEKWVAHQPFSAVCRAEACGSIAGLSKATHNPAESPYFSCTCGVYAAKTIEHLRQCGYKRFGLFGEVYMWGKVVEHEHGWRAQFAYPKTLFLAADTIPFSLSEINARIKTQAEFGTDIFLLHDRERVTLWKRGSGFDAAGLDYLIKTRKEYYIRRQQERTLKTSTVCLPDGYPEKGRPHSSARSRHCGGRVG